MSQSSINPAIILNELSSGDVKSLMEHLEVFLKFLEEKNDPEPIEIQVVDSMYQLVEKFQMFEEVMRKYQETFAEELLGKKLDQLYSSSAIGTSKLFNI
jgi:hypothetical protein